MTLLDAVFLWWWGVLAASIVGFAYSFYSAGRKAGKRVEDKERFISIHIPKPQYLWPHGRVVKNARR
jgi:hypothetical protein